MSRGREPAGGIPAEATLWSSVNKVDPNHRLRWPKEISQFVPWLSAEQKGPIACIATLGPFGGIQICPDGRGVEIKRKISTRLKNVPADADEVAEEWVSAARFLATSWKIAINVEANGRFSLTLPEDARKLEVVPSAGQAAVTFAVGQIVEVWRHDRWVELNQRTSQKFNRLAEAIQEELDATENE
jgi:hypothetical protein